MDLAAKLQLKGKVRVLNAPAGLDLDLPTTDDAKAEAVLLFVATAKELKAKGKPAIEAARADKLAWIAYPKAGQLGTDLNRDTLNALMNQEGAQAVRSVSIDGVWSALRFRPK
jgi:hypothetical protein